jgi:hypothetical protein
MKLFAVTFGLLLVLSSCNPTNTSAILSSEQFPVDFPLPPLTNEQVQEVSTCAIQEIADRRYSQGILARDLSEVYAPKSNCDWMVLALAIAEREQSRPSEIGLEAFEKSITGNYGFIFAPLVFEYYFDSVSMVNAPFANHTVETVEVNYLWSGMGEPSRTEHRFTIEGADDEPTVTFHSETIDTNSVPDKSSIQNLAKALTNLLPVETEAELIYCTDNYPRWSIFITFTDGTQIEMKTTSNLIPPGGPWHMEFEGQHYVQYSVAFAREIGKLMETTQLPLGEPAAMGCFGGPSSILESFFHR